MKEYARKNNLSIQSILEDSKQATNFQLEGSKYLADYSLVDSLLDITQTQSHSIKTKQKQKLQDEIHLISFVSSNCNSNQEFQKMQTNNKFTHQNSQSNNDEIEVQSRLKIDESNKILKKDGCKKEYMHVDESFDEINEAEDKENLMKNLNNQDFQKYLFDMLQKHRMIKQDSNQFDSPKINLKHEQEIRQLKNNNNIQIDLLNSKIENLQKEKNLVRTDNILLKNQKELKLQDLLQNSHQYKQNNQFQVNSRQNQLQQSVSFDFQQKFYKLNDQEYQQIIQNEKQKQKQMTNQNNYNSQCGNGRIRIYDGVDLPISKLTKKEISQQIQFLNHILNSNGNEESIDEKVFISNSKLNYNSKSSGQGICGNTQKLVSQSSRSNMASQKFPMNLHQELKLIQVDPQMLEIAEQRQDIFNIQDNSMESLIELNEGDYFNSALQKQQYSIEKRSYKSKQTDDFQNTNDYNQYLKMQNIQQRKRMNSMSQLKIIRQQSQIEKPVSFFCQSKKSDGLKSDCQHIKKCSSKESSPSEIQNGLKMEINLNANEAQFENIVSCKSLNINKHMLLGMDSKQNLLNAQHPPTTSNRQLSKKCRTRNSQKQNNTCNNNSSHSQYNLRNQQVVSALPRRQMSQYQNVLAQDNIHFNNQKIQKQENLSLKALRIFSEKTKSVEESLDLNIDNAEKGTHNSKKSNYFVSSQYYCDHTPRESTEENVKTGKYLKKSLNQNQMIFMESDIQIQDKKEEMTANIPKTSKVFVNQNHLKNQIFALESSSSINNFHEKKEDLQRSKINKFLSAQNEYEDAYNIDGLKSQMIGQSMSSSSLKNLKNQQLKILSRQPCTTQNQFYKPQSFEINCQDNYTELQNRQNQKQNNINSFKNINLFTSSSVSPMQNNDNSKIQNSRKLQDNTYIRHISLLQSEDLASQNNKFQSVCFPSKKIVSIISQSSNQDIQIISENYLSQKESNGKSCSAKETLNKPKNDSSQNSPFQIFTEKTSLINNKQEQIISNSKCDLKLKKIYGLKNSLDRKSNNLDLPIILPKQRNFNALKKQNYCKTFKNRSSNEGASENPNSQKPCTSQQKQSQYQNGASSIKMCITVSSDKKESESKIKNCDSSIKQQSIFNRMFNQNKAKKRLMITEASQNLSPSLVDYSLSQSNCGSKYANYYALNHGYGEEAQKHNFIQNQIKFNNSQFQIKQIIEQNLKDQYNDLDQENLLPQDYIQARLNLQNNWSLQNSQLLKISSNKFDQANQNTIKKDSKDLLFFNKMQKNKNDRFSIPKSFNPSSFKRSQQEDEIEEKSHSSNIDDENKQILNTSVYEKEILYQYNEDVNKNQIQSIFNQYNSKSHQKQTHNVYSQYNKIKHIKNCSQEMTNRDYIANGNGSENYVSISVIQPMNQSTTLIPFSEQEINTKTKLQLNIQDDQNLIKPEITKSLKGSDLKIENQNQEIYKNWKEDINPENYFSQNNRLENQILQGCEYQNKHYNTERSSQLNNYTMKKNQEANFMDQMESGSGQIINYDDHHEVLEVNSQELQFPSFKQTNEQPQQLFQQRFLTQNDVYNNQQIIVDQLDSKKISFDVTQKQNIFSIPKIWTKELNQIKTRTFDVENEINIDKKQSLKEIKTFQVKNFSAKKKAYEFTNECTSKKSLLQKKNSIPSQQCQTYRKQNDPLQNLSQINNQSPWLVGQKSIDQQIFTQEKIANRNYFMQIDQVDSENFESQNDEYNETDEVEITQRDDASIDIFREQIQSQMNSQEECSVSYNQNQRSSASREDICKIKSSNMISGRSKQQKQQFKTFDGSSINMALKNRKYKQNSCLAKRISNNQPENIVQEILENPQIIQSQLSQNLPKQQMVFKSMEQVQVAQKETLPAQSNQKLQQKQQTYILRNATTLGTIGTQGSEIKNKNVQYLLR